MNLQNAKSSNDGKNLYAPKCQLQMALSGGSL
jgi:hypothetical protein